jgi:hypothetical protein
MCDFMKSIASVLRTHRMLRPSPAMFAACWLTAPVISRAARTRCLPPISLRIAAHWGELFRLAISIRASIVSTSAWNAARRSAPTDLKAERPIILCSGDCHRTQRQCGALGKFVDVREIVLKMRCGAMRLDCCLIRIKFVQYQPARRGLIHPEIIAQIAGLGATGVPSRNLPLQTLPRPRCCLP